MEFALEIEWTVPYSVGLTCVDLYEIRANLIEHMQHYPDFTYHDLQSIVWSFIEEHFEYDVYIAFEEAQCDIVLNKVLEGFGIQLSMFDSKGNIIEDLNE